MEFWGASFRLFRGSLMETKVGARLWVPADQAFFDITNRPISDNVLRFSTTASCGSIVIPNWFSRNVTTLSTAMESRIPVVTSAVVSVNAAGSSPGKNSLRINVLTVALMVCSSVIEMSGIVGQSKPYCHHVFVVFVASLVGSAPFVLNAGPAISLWFRLVD